MDDVNVEDGADVAVEEAIPAPEASPEPVEPAPAVLKVGG